MYLLSDSGIEYLLAYTFYTFFIFPCEEREVGRSVWAHSVF